MIFFFYHKWKWLQGRRSPCQCDNPLKPLGRQDRANWEQLHQAHVATAQMHVKKADKIDVLFMGDSITEGWSGKFMGQPAPSRLGKSPKVFASLFSKDDGGRYKGLALGISGDKASRVVYGLDTTCFAKDSVVDLTFLAMMPAACCSLRFLYSLRRENIRAPICCGESKMVNYPTS